MLASVGRSEHCHHGSLYVQGMLLDGECKSIEPLAARVPGGNVQALQQFVGQSPWAWEPVRRLLAQHLEEALLPTAGWIVDDTGFPKQKSRWEWRDSIRERWGRWATAPAHYSIRNVRDQASRPRAHGHLATVDPSPHRKR